MDINRDTLYCSHKFQIYEISKESIKYKKWIIPGPWKVLSSNKKQTSSFLKDFHLILICKSILECL